MLQSIQVFNLRNIQRLSLNNLQTFNMITGINGAGKTSLLEAIHILTTGKSFRTNQIAKVIQDNCDELVVSGKLTTNTKLGVSRNRKADFQVRVNDQNEKKLSTLAMHLPVRHIAPDSFLMLTSGSKLRRQFLDFSVFHVKHQFADCWKNYQRQLKQRNALLKQANNYTELKVWDDQMLDNIVVINEMRETVFQQLKVYLQANQLTFLPQYKVQYSLRTGVGTDDLKSQYEKSFTSDKRYGHSTLGPHKADIDVTIDGQDAHTIISRGEMKMLIISMILAQIDWLREVNKDSCLLIDDLTSELDKSKQALLLDNLIKRSGLQCFISSINLPDYFQSNKVQDVAMFHVEHGSLV